MGGSPTAACRVTGAPNRASTDDMLEPRDGRSAGTAAGSFGQFLFSPLAHALIDAFSWQTALLLFAGLMLLVLPLSTKKAT